MKPNRAKLLLNLIMKRKTTIHGMLDRFQRFQTILGDSRGLVLSSPRTKLLMLMKLILRMKLKLLLNKTFKKKTIILGMLLKLERFPMIPEDNHGQVLESPRTNLLKVMKLQMQHKLLLKNQLINQK